MAQASAPADGSRVYHSVVLNDNAYAIFGDGHFNAGSLPYLSNTNPEERRWLLLRSLYFDNMGTRKAQIQARAGSPKYVEWVWNTNFLPWLESADSVYWITGKAGSGKSTLMMHISESSRTKQALMKNGGSWNVIRFFFDFRAGKALGNNALGLIRSLLYQLVQEVPEVSKHLNHDMFDGTHYSSTYGECLDNLCHAVNASATNVCAFIDGLDEYDGSYSDLLGVIEMLRHRLGSVSGLKLCLASRPYPAFQETFDRVPTLVMQDHNDVSIELYANSQWLDHRISPREQLPQQLCTMVRNKARGVFLWARLAIDELVIDFVNGKPLAELHEQLNAMPEEVEGMYQRCLDRLPISHQHEAAAVLYILLQSQGQRIFIDLLYAALRGLSALGHTDSRIIPVDEAIDNKPRLLALLGDLLDVQQEADYPYGSQQFVRIIASNGAIIYTQERRYEATLAHETLKSFLLTSRWFARILHPELTRNQGSLFWTHLYLSEITASIQLGAVGKISDKDIWTKVCNYREETMQTIRTRKQLNDVSAYGICIRAYETALPIMNGLTGWSNLLLYALHGLLDHISRLENYQNALVSRISPLLGSPVFALHYVSCSLNNLWQNNPWVIEFEDLDNDGLTDLECGEDWSGTAFCGNLIQDIAEDELIWCRDIFILSLHGLEVFIPHLIRQCFRSLNAKQLVFDLLLRTYLMLGMSENPPNSQRITNTILAFRFLIDEGCYLSGEHLCTLTSGLLGCWEFEVVDVLLESLPEGELSHKPTYSICTSVHGRVGHLMHLTEESDGSLLSRTTSDSILGALVSHGADFNKYFEETGDNFLARAVPGLGNELKTFEQDTILFNVEIIMDSGCDPFAKGNQGDVFDAITACMEQNVQEGRPDRNLFLEKFRALVLTYVQPGSFETASSSDGLEAIMSG